MRKLAAVSLVLGGLLVLGATSFRKKIRLIPDEPAAASVNTQIINAALVKNGQIELPEGIFYVNGEIKVDREGKIVGQGPLLTIIRAASDFSFPDNETAIIHQYRDGLPAKYDLPGPTGRIYLEDIYIDGSNVAGANGILASLQQPAAWRNVRVDNCPGYGIALCDTVQAVFSNIEIINCGVGLRMRSALLCYFHGVNIEQSISRDIVFETISTSTTGSNWNHFLGLHLESAATSSAGFVSIEVLEAEANLFMNVYFPGGANSSTLFYFKAAVGAEEQALVYTLINIVVEGDPTTVTVIDDQDRGIVLNGFSDIRRYIPLLVAGPHNPTRPANSIFIPELGGVLRRL